MLSCILNADQDLVKVAGSISDDKLRDITFSYFLKTAATFSADSLVYQQMNLVVQVLWELLKTSSHFLRQKFAKYLADESHLVNSTLEANLESHSKTPEEFHSKLLLL